MWTDTLGQSGTGRRVEILQASSSFIIREKVSKIGTWNNLGGRVPTSGTF